MEMPRQGGGNINGNAPPRGGNINGNAPPRGGNERKKGVAFGMAGKKKRLGNN